MINSQVPPSMGQRYFLEDSSIRERHKMRLTWLFDRIAGKVTN